MANFLLKFQNFRYHGNRGWCDTNFVCTVKFFDRDVEDVIDALWLQFFKCFISVTVNMWGTLDHPFAGVHCPVRAGSQNVQLIDCATLGGSRDWMVRSPDRRCLISLTVPVAVFMALSMRNGDSAVPDRLTE